MKTRDMHGSGDAGLAAALRRFPASAHDVGALFARSDAFRTLCDDLAAAEAALAGIEHLPEAVRADRRRECASWITGLSAEIAEALLAQKVVSLADARSARE